MNAHTAYASSTGVVTLRPIVTRNLEGRPVANSRDIATYFGKEHRNVLQDIDRLITESPGRGLLAFQHTPYVHPQNGQTYRSFDMTRDGFTLLAMGFTGAKALKFKLAYIAEFNAMEAQLAQPPAPQFAIPQTLPEALRLAAEQAERAIAAEERLAITAPKAKALDELEDVTGTYTLTEAAKNFRIPPRKEFISVLLEWGILYQRGRSSSILPNERFLQSGYFVVKTKRHVGSISQQTRVTAKGMAWLATKLHRFEREGAF